MLRNDNFIKFFKTAYCFTDSQRNTAYENWISENVKDKIVIDLDKKEPLEIVRSGSSGISSNSKTLTI